MDIQASQAALIYQNLRKEFQAGITEARTVADPLYQTVPSTSDSNVYGWLGHIPGFKEMFKGQTRVHRNVESQSYTVANRKFEDTIEIDLDTVDDNQLGSYAGLAKSFGAVGMSKKDEVVFELMNNGFTTALAYDGLSWFNDAHKVGLSTVDNDLGSISLTEANLEAAMVKLRGFTVQPDKLSKARPLEPLADKLLLVVNPALWATASKMVSLRTVSTGGENFLYKAAEVLSTSYVTSTTAWFLLNVGAPMKPVIFQNRKDLQFRMLTPDNSDGAFDRDVYIYGAKMRCAALPSLPWLACGSRGA